MTYAKACLVGLNKIICSG